MKYECHITIDPVEGSQLEHFEVLCQGFHFKVAKLFKQSGAPSDKDQFATGHGVSIEELRARMYALCVHLSQYGFRIRRYKIEEILLDSRRGDALGLLKEEKT